MIDSEKFIYDSQFASGFNFTNRAVDGTSAAAHPSGAPVSTFVRNGSVTIEDMAGLVGRFGSSGDQGVDPLSWPEPSPAYHTAFDRTLIGPNIWNLGPPNGSITVQDIAMVVAQFGHTCV
jgi:hypothetical protein